MMKQSFRGKNSPRRPGGMTLVELLVVIVILLAVTAAAIPVVLPAVENRRIREASRLVTSYMAGARSRALRTGRSTGILIERFEGQPEMGIVLSEVEVQAPYGGDTIFSRIQIVGGLIDEDRFLDRRWQGLVRPGSLLKLNYQGPLYRVGPNAPVDQLGDCNTGDWDLQPTPRDTPDEGVPYQIFRQPAKTARAPLQLPESIAIDLVFSGDGNEFFVPSIDADGDSTNGIQDPTPVLIMFSPGGSVDRLYHSAADLSAGTAEYESHPPSGPVMLLLGRREKIPLDVTDAAAINDLEQNNLIDLTNIWISVQPQTGHIATTENSPIVTTPLNPATLSPLDTYDMTPMGLAILEARLLALEAQGMGGR